MSGTQWLWVVPSVPAPSHDDAHPVTDMSFMFDDASSFDGDISQWDTSRVSTMEQMFADAAAFNKNLGQWDTSKVSGLLGHIICDVIGDAVGQCNIQRHPGRSIMYSFL